MDDLVAWLLHPKPAEICRTFPRDRVRRLLMRETYPGISTEVLVEGPFLELTPEGAPKRQVFLGITSSEFVIVRQNTPDNRRVNAVPKDIDLYCLELDRAIPLGLLRFFVIDNRSKRLNVCTSDGCVLMFEMCQMELDTDALWAKWRQLLKTCSSEEDDKAGVKTWYTPFAADGTQRVDPGRRSFGEMVRSLKKKGKLEVLYYLQHPTTFYSINTIGVQTAIGADGKIPMDGRIMVARNEKNNESAKWKVKRGVQKSRMTPLKTETEFDVLVKECLRRRSAFYNSGSLLAIWHHGSGCETTQIPRSISDTEMRHSTKKREKTETFPQLTTPTGRNGIALWRVASKQLLHHRSTRIEGNVDKIPRRKMEKGPVLTFDVRKIRPTELADYITSENRKLILTLTARDIAVFVKSVANQIPPNLAKIVMFSDDVSRLVTTDLLKFQTLRQRVAGLRFFVQVCMWLLSYQDYQGIVAVIRGMTSLPVYRLDVTWAAFSKLRPVAYSQFLWLSCLYSPKNHFAGYCRRLDYCLNKRESFLPWLDHFLQHSLTFKGPDSLMSDEHSVYYDGKNILKKYGFLKSNKRKKTKESKKIRKEETARKKLNKTKAKNRENPNGCNWFSCFSRQKTSKDRSIDKDALASNAKTDTPKNSDKSFKKLHPEKANVKTDTPTNFYKTQENSAKQARQLRKKKVNTPADDTVSKEPTVPIKNTTLNRELSLQKLHPEEANIDVQKQLKPRWTGSKQINIIDLRSLDSDDEQEKDTKEKRDRSEARKNEDKSKDKSEPKKDRQRGSSRRKRRSNREKKQGSNTPAESHKEEQAMSKIKRRDLSENANEKPMIDLKNVKLVRKLKRFGWTEADHINMLNQEIRSTEDLVRSVKVYDFEDEPKTEEVDDDNICPKYVFADEEEKQDDDKTAQPAFANLLTRKRSLFAQEIEEHPRTQEDEAKEFEQLKTQQRCLGSQKIILFASDDDGDDAIAIHKSSGDVTANVEVDNASQAGERNRSNNSDNKSNQYSTRWRLSYESDSKSQRGGRNNQTTRSKRSFEDDLWRHFIDSCHMTTNTTCVYCENPCVQLQKFREVATDVLSPLRTDIADSIQFVFKANRYLHEYDLLQLSLNVE